MQDNKYKPVNWLHAQAIQVADNMTVTPQVSENSGRIKLDFGRFDDGKYGFTHESLKALFFSDVAIARMREYLTSVEDTCEDIRAEKKAKNEVAKQQRQVERKLAPIAEILSQLSPEQIAALLPKKGA